MSQPSLCYSILRIKALPWLCAMCASVKCRWSVLWRIYRDVKHTRSVARFLTKILSLHLFSLDPQIANGQTKSTRGNAQQSRRKNTAVALLQRCSACCMSLLYCSAHRHGAIWPLLIGGLGCRSIVRSQLCGPPAGRPPWPGRLETRSVRSRLSYRAKPKG
jgi:hypothetical protein